jgi:hypothetical protein
MASTSLQFGSEFWTTHLPNMQKASIQTKLHLLVSLMMFLSVTIQQLLVFMFSTDIKAVKDRASRFMGYFPTGMGGVHFAPTAVFELWHKRWPGSRNYLHDMIIPCAHEIVLEESDRIIKDSTLRVRIKDLKISDLRDLLHPDKLVTKYQTSAPLTFGLMTMFAASPNKYRKEKSSRASTTTQSMPEHVEDNPFVDLGNDEILEGSDDDDDAEPSPGSQWWKEFEGLSRNPVFVSLNCMFL